MKTKKIPMRRCIGCGEQKNKADMMRVLKTPEGTFLLDLTGKQNGRGAYLCRKKDCFQKAVKTKGLERSFQMQIPRETYEILERELENLEER